MTDDEQERVRTQITQRFLSNYESARKRLVGNIFSPVETKGAEAQRLAVRMTIEWHDGYDADAVMASAAVCGRRFANIDAIVSAKMLMGIGPDLVDTIEPIYHDGNTIRGSIDSKEDIETSWEIAHRKLMVMAPHKKPRQRFTIWVSPINLCQFQKWQKWSPSLKKIDRYSLNILALSRLIYCPGWFVFWDDQPSLTKMEESAPDMRVYDYDERYAEFEAIAWYGARKERTIRIKTPVSHA